MVWRPNFSRIYVFRYGESEFDVHHEPEVELMLFVCMCSNNITNSGENAPKMQLEGQIFTFLMFFDTGNPNLRSILKPKIMVFPRRGSYKITNNGEKCSQSAVWMLISRGPREHLSTQLIRISLSGRCSIFQNQDFECQVCFETGVVIQSMCCPCSPNSTASFESCFM